MDAMRIEVVRETRPALEIKTTPAKLTIKNRRPRMKIRSQRPEMKIKREAPRFRSGFGERQNRLRGGGRAARAQAARMRERTLEAIGRILRLTDEVAPTDTVTPPPVVVRDLSNDYAFQEIELNDITDELPRVEWDPGYFTIEWSDYVLEIEWEDIGAPQIEVEPHSIEVRIRNEPVVRFVLNTKKLKDGVGDKVDEKI
ncbi:MAG: DUF6470 family protein [Clostridiales bacterium]|jgi:hypothetical protein|nr:DUF6470 family protein [Clostridiales bacterium]